MAISTENFAAKGLQCDNTFFARSKQVQRLLIGQP